MNADILGAAMHKCSYLAWAVLSVAPAFAQLAAPNDMGITMGHIHLAVKDVDAQKAFLVSGMGGTVVKNGPLELIQFPGT